MKGERVQVDNVLSNRPTGGLGGMWEQVHVLLPKHLFWRAQFRYF